MARKAKIIELPSPKRRTPKQLARAYMMGELSPDEYPVRGGLRERFLAADQQKGMAQDAALKAIEKLAELESEQDPNQVIDIKLVAIENRGGTIVEAGTA